MTEIHFTPEAIADLQETQRYITEELCSEAAAKNTISRIMKTIKGLEAFPEIGAPLRSIVPFETTYRFLVCGKYTVFYRYENDAVYIVRVLFSGRNYMQILFGEPDEA